jgi:hypothetical protein
MMRRGPGLIGMAARTAVVAGTATAVSGGMRRRQEAKYEQQQEAAQPQQAAPQQAAPAPAPAAGGDTIAELERLGQLRQQGLLTDEEFAAAKAKLLGM